MIDTHRIGSLNVLMDTFICTCGVLLCRPLPHDVASSMHHIVLLWELETLLVFLRDKLENEMST
jgi:hypothetical protein